LPDKKEYIIVFNKDGNIPKKEDFSMKKAAYLLIISATCSLYATHDDGKEPKKEPLNIFNYVYAKGEGTAKNKPFHLSQQKNKMKHEQASNFWEKMLSMAAAGVGVAAGSVYVVKSILIGKSGQSTGVLKREIQRLKILLSNVSKKENMQKVNGLLAKIFLLSKRLGRK